MKNKIDKPSYRNYFRTNKILKKCMPGIRTKLAVITGIFVTIILISATLFNYIHEGRILEKGIIRETENSLKLINSVIMDMENVRGSLLLIEEMKSRIEEKKKDLVKLKKVAYKRKDSISNSIKYLGQKFGMKVKYEYHPVIVESYYSVYLPESEIKKVEKGVIAQLKNKSGQVISENDFRTLQGKARNLTMILKDIEAIQQRIYSSQSRIGDLDGADRKSSAEINYIQKEIFDNEKTITALEKKRLSAERVLRNYIRQYFEYEFVRMEQAGINSGEIRIISSDKTGEVVYDSGSNFRDAAFRYTGLLGSEKYRKNRDEFFSTIRNGSASYSNAEYDYNIKSRAFHVQILPLYRNPATYERFNLIINEMRNNSSRWSKYLKVDYAISAKISEIVLKIKERRDQLVQKKIPPGQDNEYQSYYKQYQKLVVLRKKSFDELNPHKDEKKSIAEYYSTEIKKEEDSIKSARARLELQQLSRNSKSEKADSDAYLIQTSIAESKDKLELLKSEQHKSLEDIGRSEKLFTQDAFANLRDAALYDHVVLRFGNNEYPFNEYQKSSQKRLIELKRWDAVRDWIYRAKSETQIPEKLASLRNIKTIDNGILSYSRSEAEEYMWKLDGTPLSENFDIDDDLRNNAGLTSELLTESTTGYNEVIIDKTTGLQMIKENRKTMLTYSGIIIALAFLLTYFFAGFIVRRIRGIIDQAKRAAKGDLDVTFPEKGIDEIEDMAVSLNEMMNGLRERKELEGEMSAAAVIQKQLLPEIIPSDLDENYSIGKLYRPMRGVGGDYYDFISLGNNKILFCIGDVSNHGVGPAMVMAILRAHLHAIIRNGEHGLIKILCELNRQIFLETPDYIFVTFFIGIIDGETNEIEFCSAGHMKPLVYSYQNDEVEMLDCGGIPIGMDDNDFFTETIKTQKVKMKAGDLFFQYTDGVNEAMNCNRDLYGGKRLIAEIKKSARKKPDILIKNIAQSVEKFTGNDLVEATGMTDYNDDIAMIAIKRIR